MPEKYGLGSAARSARTLRPSSTLRQGTRSISSRSPAPRLAASSPPPQTGPTAPAGRSRSPSPSGTPIDPVPTLLLEQGNRHPGRAADPRALPAQPDAALHPRDARACAGRRRPDAGGTVGLIPGPQKVTATETATGKDHDVPGNHKHPAPGPDCWWGARGSNPEPTD